MSWEDVGVELVTVLSGPGRFPDNSSDPDMDFDDGVQHFSSEIETDSSVQDNGTATEKINVVTEENGNITEENGTATSVVNGTEQGKICSAQAILL